MKKSLGKISWRALLGIFIAAGGFAAMKAYDQSQKLQHAQQQKKEEPAGSQGGLLTGYQVAKVSGSQPSERPRLVTANTVGEFMIFCISQESGASISSCGNYIQGAIDQIALDGSVTCVKELLSKHAAADVWLRLDEMSKDKGRQKDLLWSATRAAVYETAPACTKR